MPTKFKSLTEVWDLLKHDTNLHMLDETMRIVVDFIDPHTDETPYYRVLLVPFIGAVTEL